MLKIFLWPVFLTKGEGKSAFVICLVDKRRKKVSSFRKPVYGVDFFTQLTRGRKRGNGFEWVQGRSGLDIWKNFHQKGYQGLEQTAQKSGYHPWRYLKDI